MRHALIVLSCFACASAAEEGGEDEADITVEITSPERGERFTTTDTVHLQVRVQENGRTPAELGDVVWTVAGERAQGLTAEVKRLDEGTWDVKVDAAVKGVHYSDRISITVTRGEGDADTDSDSDVDADADADADADGDVTFSGTLSAHVWYDGEFGTFDGSCPGPLTLTWKTDDTLAGSGQCQLDGEYDLPFTIDGRGNGGNISGDLIMDSDGTEYRTPYTGSGKKNTDLSANFDKTFRDGSDSVRIAGTWAASPQ
jgi:hypothetical protein